MASLTQLVGDVHHLLGQLCHLPALEGLEILVFLAGYAVLVVIITLIHDVLWPEFIAHFLFKLLQDIGGHGGGVAIPVHVLFPAAARRTPG